MFSLEQLAGFIAVAEELHFGRAAERLSMTQPPLSRRVQQLERELGVPLFVRGPRAVALTPAGAAFLPDARRLLKLADEAAANSRRAPTGAAGVVTIGFTAASAYSYLAGLLDLAGRKLPGAEVRLRELVSSAQLAALADATIDLGLVRPPVRAPELASRLVAVEPMLAAIPVTARRRKLQLRDFDDASLVMYQPTESAYFHDLLLGAFASARVRPRVTQYVSQVHTALALVRAGLGWAIVPAAARALQFDGVSLVPVRGLDDFPAELVMAWRPDRANPARDALIAAVRPVRR